MKSSTFHHLIKVPLCSLRPRHGSSIQLLLREYNFVICSLHYWYWLVKRNSARFDFFDTFQFWHFPILTLSNSDTFQFWHFPILTLFNSDTFQFWHLSILTLSNSDTFQFWHFPIFTVSNSDTFQLWYFPILTLSNSDTFQFWHFPILTPSNSDTFQFWYVPIMTLSNYDTFQFWHFPTLTLSNSEEKCILTLSSLSAFGSRWSLHYLGRDASSFSHSICMGWSPESAIQAM